MIRALFFSLLLVFGLEPQDGFAQHNVFIGVNPTVPAPPPSGCPFSVDNGCANSIPGQPGSTAVMLPNARATPTTNTVNLLSGTPTDYSANLPAINEAAIDFWVGDPLPQSSLGDPTTLLPAMYSALPTLCVYNPTANPAGGPTILCTVNGTSNLTIDGLDFAPNSTTCIPLRVQGNTTGTITVTRNNWKNNGTCNYDVIGTPMFSEAVSLANSTTSLMYNTVDDNGINFPYEYYGACPQPTVVGGTICNPTVSYVLIGQVDVEYNAFLNTLGRPIQYASENVTKGSVFAHNLLQGCCSQNPAAHGEFEEYLGNPGGAGHSYISNTFIDTTAHTNIGDGAFPSQFTTSNLVPVLDFEENILIEGSSGGSTPSTTFAGSINGNTFTTSSIATGTTLGSGTFLTCGTSPNNMSAVNRFDGSTGTVSAGPGGGGNSNGHNGAGGTTWPLLWGSTFITGTLDNGSGGAGNTLTVSADQTLILTVGTRVGISGNRNITALGTGTGTTGTYTVDGAAALVGSSTILATPPNIFPGHWATPGTVTCASQTIHSNLFARAVLDVVGPMGQVTNKNNYVDMWVYGPTTAGTVNANRGSVLVSFYGTISGGTVLTVNGQNLTSTTVNAGGSLYTSAPTVVYTATCAGQSPLGTASLGSGGTAGQVVSIAQTQIGIGCASAPGVSFTGGGGSGATATANLVNPVVVKNGIIDTPGTTPGMFIASGTYPTYALSVSSTNIGPIILQQTQTYCTVAPTIWGGNVDMSGIYNTAPGTIGDRMNSYTSNIAGNGC